MLSGYWLVLFCHSETPIIVYGGFKLCNVASVEPACTIYVILKKEKECCQHLNNGNNEEQHLRCPWHHCSVANFGCLFATGWVHWTVFKNCREEEEKCCWRLWCIGSSAHHNGNLRVDLAYDPLWAVLSFWLLRFKRQQALQQHHLVEQAGSSPAEASCNGPSSLGLTGNGLPLLLPQLFTLHLPSQNIFASPRPCLCILTLANT